MRNTNTRCIYDKVEARVSVEEISLSMGSDTEISDDIYLVEAIQGICIIQGEVRYKVKWLNWSDGYSTWEPKDNLAGCYETLENFHGKLKERLSDGTEKYEFPLWWNYVCSINKSGFACKKCFRMFSRKFSLQRHINFTHKSRQKMVKCEDCHENFKNEQSFETHRRQVCGKLRIPCKFCANLFLPKFLKAHIKGKHYNYRVKCKICGTPLWNKNLAHHVKTQHGLTL